VNGKINSGSGRVLKLSDLGSIEPTMSAGSGSQKINKHPLHFIWICDCSAAMKGDRIQDLNSAISDGLGAIEDEAENNPEIMVKMSVMRFATTAEWAVKNPTPVDQMTWPNLDAGGDAKLGRALFKVAGRMTIPPMPDRACPPVLIVTLSRNPTDNVQEGLTKLFSTPWGKEAVRIGIGIGSDADHDTLEKFVRHPEIPVLQANNPEDLTRFIRWAPVEVTT